VLTLGVDIGTSSLKLGAVDVATGELKAWAGENYTLMHPQPGWSELDAENYWQTFVKCLIELKKTVDLRKIKAVSIRAQGQSFVPIDSNGTNLQNAWTWIDSRAAAEAQELTNRFPNDQIFQKTGIEGVSPGTLASMIKFIRQNNPSLFSATWKFLITSSFLIWRLTGRTVIDENLASISGMYDWHKKQWWPEMLQAIGVDETKLPEVLPSGCAVERVLPKIATELDLSPDTIIVTGANDQTANALGAGLVDEKEMLIVLGTALIIFKVLSPDEKPCPRGFWNPYPVPGKTYQLGYTNTGCGTLDWSKNLLASEVAYPDLFTELSRVPAGCEGVTCLIDLDGRPGADGSDYRGMFAGISRKTDRWTMLRSVLEGVACSVRELAGELGWNVAGKDIRAVGGGARSDLWLKIHANLLNATLRRLDHDQSGVVGSAIMAAVGAGIFKTYEQAVERIVKLAHRIDPDPQDVREYQAIYERFHKLRKAGDQFYIGLKK